MFGGHGRAQQDHNSRPARSADGGSMMIFVKSSRQARRRAILWLSVVVFILALSLPSYALDLGGDDEEPPKKCPSGKAWSNKAKKCVAQKSGWLSDEDIARAGRQLARDGHYREAIAVLETIANKGDPVVLTYLGYSHRKLGDVDFGISLYKRALEIDPENVATREYLGEGYVTKGALDLAYLELVEIEKRCGPREGHVAGRSQY